MFFYWLMETQIWVDKSHCASNVPSSTGSIYGWTQGPGKSFLIGIKVPSFQDGNKKACLIIMTCMFIKPWMEIIKPLRMEIIKPLTSLLIVFYNCLHAQVLLHALVLHPYPMQLGVNESYPSTGWASAGMADFEYYCSKISTLKLR